MSRKRKDKKRKGADDDPIQCTDCPFCECQMKEIAKNHVCSHYVCSLTGNDVPQQFSTLIPKWCPKGYENLFD